MTETLTVFVILGATGDLASRKIVPGLFHLYEKGLLPKGFRVLGFSRRGFSDEEFRKYLSQKVFERHPDLKQKKSKFQKFQECFTYQKGDFNEKAAFQELAEALKTLGTTNRLFHLSVPPKFYQQVLTKLHESDLTGERGGWTRLIIEKPFGRDHRTAKQLDNLLSRIMNDEQIYRIDHYLAKEMVLNILSFRFSNYLLEGAWNKNSIDKIDIRLWEEIGVESRGLFYDDLGALRDVGQNHLLQLLAFVTMENPGSFTDQAIRSSRAKLLSYLRVPDRKEVEQHSSRAQYTEYQEVEGVKPGSRTETYFSARAFLDLPRWQGVPVYLESGKCMSEVKKEVVVTFRHPSPCLCPSGEEHRRNQVVFSIEPDEGIFIRFWAKRPGLTFETKAELFQFLLPRRGQKKIQYIEEYVKLLSDALSGDRTLFLSSQEVASMWKFVDPIIRGWEKYNMPLNTYRKGTNP